MAAVARCGPGSLPAPLRLGSLTRNTPIRKISDYLQHAADCERLAQTADTAEHKATLLRMAATWRELAAARERDLKRRERLAEIEMKDDKIEMTDVEGGQGPADSGSRDAERP
jgi:hypothetical protein